MEPLEKNKPTYWRKTMIRLIAVAAFGLAVATSAQAMSPAPLHRPDGMYTQVIYGRGVARRTVRRHMCRCRCWCRCRALLWRTLLSWRISLLERRGLRRLPRVRVREPPVREPRIREPPVCEPRIREPRIREPRIREPRVREPRVREPRVREPRAPALVGSRREGPILHRPLR